jgi:hypothetical protein
LKASRHCKLCGVALTAENSYKNTGLKCKTCHNALSVAYIQEHRTHEYKLLHAAKARAKRDGFPCTIEESDITIPDVCPVLGIPLKRGVGASTEASPTLDKLIPALGYVRGNVRVISFRANRLKNDATLDELKALVRYLEEA